MSEGSFESFPVEYANWWSKALFAKAYEKQFVIPVPPPRPMSWMLELLERTAFRKDLSAIRIERPIFIVGLPRSGTSILYDLLCAHEHSAYVTNCINGFTNAILAIEWMRKRFKLNIRGERFLQDSVVADFGTPSEPAIFWGKWIDRDLYSLYWPEKRGSDFSPEKISEIHTDVRKMLHAFGADPSGAGTPRRFICKYPVFQTELRMINDLFPDAIFVHIVRDGRQTANSLIKLYRLVNSQIRKIDHPYCRYMIPYPRVVTLPGLIAQYGPEDIRCTANVWQDSIDAVHSVKDSLSSFIEIRYEDILNNPETEILGLMSKLGLTRPAPENRFFWDYLSRVGHVRHTNQYGQFDVVERIAGRTLQKMGYVSGNPSERRPQVAVTPRAPDRTVDQIM
jgi:hypothetical protein